MPIIRLIHITIDPGQSEDVEQIWNQECAPLMIRQKGCLTEKLLKCSDVGGQYISYSEWEDEEAIEAYRKSDDHETIKNHARKLQGGQAAVRLYQIVS